jgi:hypothetical protein
LTRPGRRLARHAVLAAALLLTAACGVLVAQQLDQRYGRPDPTLFDAPRPPAPGQVSWHEVDRVLRARCAVCHGCYDAPCQLKLTAWEGVARGASPERVYDTRLLAVPPSRLLEDAFGASAWRGRGFHPVLNERPGRDPLEGSVLAQMLLLKQAHPNPPDAQLPGSFDVSINRAQQCTTIEGWDEFARRSPLWGMPFGLPELSGAERELLLRWIGQGAPREAAPPPPAAVPAQIERWETWLNGDSLKRRLAARYLYEHLFLAHLHFGAEPPYFRLVRSRSAPGHPVDLIATRRPFDDPGVARPYYRFVPLGETVMGKTHMPYRLDEARLQSWQRWFDEAPYEVRTLPGYEPQAAANPFVTYADIPVRSRYRFLLDEAQFTVMGFIKGPVCRGQQALDVIDDHFWVFFADPDTIDERDQERFLAANSQNLRLPAELDTNAPVLGHWLLYAEGQKRYLGARAEFARSHALPEPQRGARLVWSGRDDSGRANPNVALTVFRHYDSASVEQGLVGAHPQSAWVISYPLLERLHYLLVAGYDVYGDLGHQLKARLYMDFLRIEGEQNFLSLLPEAAHEALEQRWYREAPQWTLDYVHAARLPDGERVEDDLQALAPPAAYEALLQRLAARAGGALAHRFELAGLPEGAPLEALRALGALRGTSLQWLPQTVLLRVRPAGGEAYWLTLLNNSAHKNVAEIFFEDRRRLPEEDTLTLVRGFLGAYPNAFWSVPEDRLPELTRRVAALAGDADYRALMDDFGVRRTNPRFWTLSDQAHEALARQDAVAFGLLDYNRLENR